MRTLVMGGTRFMGVAVVDALLGMGHEVAVFNRGTRDASWSAPVTELHGDRDDAPSLSACRAFDPAVVVDMSAYRPAQTSALIDALPDVRHWVHCSTGAVYDPAADFPWSEDTPYGPWELWGTYAVDKLGCERILRERRAGVGSTTVVRMPYVLGPGNYADREEFVLNRLLDAAPIALPGDGAAQIQFVSTTQVGEAFAAIASATPDADWHAYNVGDAVCSLVDFVRICADLTGREAAVVHVDDPSTDAPFDAANAVFPFPNAQYVLDTTAARAAGVAPTPTSVEQMVATACEHLLAHPERRAWQRTDAEAAALSFPGRV